MQVFTRRTETPDGRIEDAVFVPHWLRIDFRRQAWRGTFGFTDQATRVP
ncbi:MAG: hypothetical protein ACYCP0_05645 [Acidiferrobacteraceae bacterium]